ncbi:DEAD (asp-glu-ala-asp) box containing, RNA helicase [Rhodotorula toruloides]|uniref:RNA helicase n=1 Tax=Rhodotorula toruloides TaxID=5286 RepID=A0A511KGX4_RHOTO|nr:DEAD (asp-glu-ala-asp) box containing, RNA helicase [Rhodotorula toruloides]
MPLNAHAAARLRSKNRGSSSSRTASSTIASTSAQKAARFRNAAPKDLRWKSIVLPAELGFDDDGGLLELDEVEGVDVVYEDGRVAFKVREDDDGEPPAKKSKKGKGKAVERNADDEPEFVPVDQAHESEDEEPKFADDELLSFPAEEPDFLDEQAGEAIDAGNGEITHAVEQKTKPKKQKKEKGKKRSRDVAQDNGSNGPAIEEAADEPPFDVGAELPAWSHVPLANPLYRALTELKFTKPTEIQEKALLVGARADAQTDGEKEQEKSAFDRAPADRERDVVGIAQTGSGKTLAYGLPILSHVLSQPSASLRPSDSGSGAESSLPHTRLAALILCPTRELALQVRTSLSSLSVRSLPLRTSTPETDALAPEDPRKRKKGRLVQVVALTGGMSVEKQKRQLERGADVVVATPGRLWDLIGESDMLVQEIKNIKFLVIDEADRMIENGHFAELENIVRLTRREQATPDHGFVDDFDTAVTTRSNVTTVPCRPDMRTFVFSATMSKELQLNLKRKGGPRKFVPKAVDGDMTSLDDLLELLDFRDPDPEIIDLSPEHGLVETLKECKVECLANEKDMYLYHFLLRYPGRTIVFLAAIDGIRRLHPLLTLLKVNVIPLHSGMQQRQRLKALDKFKSSPDAVLLATDVAARGLDIPSVSHVVHYQLPRAADTYVHRSGRTARAGTEGLALQIVAPEEKKVQRMLMASLGKDIDLPTLPTDFSILDQLKKRIDLAKEIDQAQHRATKQAHEDKWLREAAEAMEIDLEDDQDSDGDGPQRSSKKQRGQAIARARQLKTELDNLLKRPLMVRGVSAKYLTTRSKIGLVDQLVGGTGHSKIFGLSTSSALEDLAEAPRTKKQKQAEKAREKKAEEQQAEE